jgi:hypothetical protein
MGRIFRGFCQSPKARSVATSITSQRALNRDTLRKEDVEAGAFDPNASTS